MTTRLLVDAAHPEETRVVVVKGHRLEDFDYESSTKTQLRGNIYLAKVTRVEPSLQAAFIDYGGNRHGFLAFSEIHPDYYQIPVADRQALLAAEAEQQSAASREAEAAAEARAAAQQSDDALDADPPEPEPEEAGSFAPSYAGGGDDAMGNDAPAPSDQDDESGEPWAGATAARSERQGSEDDESEGESEESADAGGARFDERRADDGEDETTEGGSSAAAEGGEGTDAERAEGERRRRGGRNRRDGRRGRRPQRREAGESPMPETTTTGGGDAEALDGDDFEEAARKRRQRLMRSYKIQEVIKRRQILLVQVVKEERGNKGAALTTYLSLAGRYGVLMPNTPRGGGISRKITDAKDRKRLKTIVNEMEVPDGMGLIVRTAGANRSKAELKRDYEYLVRSWDEIRETTMKSTAPALVYEEASLIKRAIRDLYSKDIEEVLVEGEEAYKSAKSFMRMLMPSHARRVQAYRDTVPLFHRYQVEEQFDAMHSPEVRLKGGGYIVINPTEALVSIDVNSGRSTKERNIEETAVHTNLEAADEVARQLRLRDLGGLVVIDFIDMNDPRHNRAVERRLKDALKVDRARIQIGRISTFGLLEMSRQRLRPSLLEASTEICPHCAGVGHVRSKESTALFVLRAIENEGIRKPDAELTVHVATPVALYLLNNKRQSIAKIEQRYGLNVILTGDDSLVPPNMRVERAPLSVPREVRPESERTAPRLEAELVPEIEEVEDEDVEIEVEAEEDRAPAEQETRRTEQPEEQGAGESEESEAASKRRRRGRRGGRRRGRRSDRPEGAESGENAEGGDARVTAEDGSAAAQAMDLGAQAPQEPMAWDADGTWSPDPQAHDEGTAREAAPQDAGEAEPGRLEVQGGSEPAKEPEPEHASAAWEQPERSPESAKAEATDAPAVEPVRTETIFASSGPAGGNGSSAESTAAESTAEAPAEPAASETMPAPSEDEEKRETRRGWWQRAFTR